MSSMFNNIDISSKVKNFIESSFNECGTERLFSFSDCNCAPFSLTVSAVVSTTMTRVF